MHLRIRFTGKALEYLTSKGHDDRGFSQDISPELMHVGDLVRHPLFPDRTICVVAREVDLIERCVTVWLDELPVGGAAAPQPASASDGEPTDSPYPQSARDD